jgi:hypothetical protein
MRRRGIQLLLIKLLFRGKGVKKGQKKMRKMRRKRRQKARQKARQIEGR